jgi:hypothetical protein
VLLDYKNAFRRGPNSKLLPFKKGPYEVMNYDKSKYYLKDLITLKVKPYHVTRISQFNYDPSKWDPLQVALRDTGDLFKVDHISAIKGDPKGPKSKLFFKVHWLGYDDKHATFEPWDNVRANVKLHEFLKQHKQAAIKALLPKNFTSLSDLPVESESEDDFES